RCDNPNAPKHRTHRNCRSVAGAPGPTPATPSEEATGSKLHSSRALTNGFDGAYRNHIHFFASPPQQSRQHAPWSKFDKIIATKIDQPLHAIEPPHSPCDLILQCATDFSRRCHLHACHLAYYSK